MGIIKKFNNSLKMVGVSLLISGTIMTAGAGMIKNKYSNYLTDYEIMGNAERYDCDTGYITKLQGHYSVLQHNGEEPIYIYLDKLLTEEEKKKSIDSLEYVFNIVKEINPHYKYELVDEETYLEKNDKSRIKYTTYETCDKNIDASAHVHRGTNMLTKLIERSLIKESIICINRETIDDQGEEYEKYIYIHELLHVFGFEDVYNVGTYKNVLKMYGNTIMNVNHTLALKKITPNDLKCLVAMYDDGSVSKEKIDAYISKYTDEFYKTYVKTVIKSTGFNENVEYENFQYTAVRSITDLDKREYGYIYTVNIQDGKYQFIIQDKDDLTVLDSTTGDVLYKDGVCILQDVSLKVGIRPYDKTEVYSDGWVADMVIGQKSGDMILYNILSNDSIKGQVYALEKNITP